MQNYFNYFNFTFEMEDFLKELIEQFCFESREILQKLENYFISYHDELIDEIYREIHTLKGNAGIIYTNLPKDFKLRKNFEVIKDIVHKYENIIKALKNGEIEKINFRSCVGKDTYL